MFLLLFLTICTQPPLAIFIYKCFVYNKSLLSIFIATVINGRYIYCQKKKCANLLVSKGASICLCIAGNTSQLIVRFATLAESHATHAGTQLTPCFIARVWALVENLSQYADHY